MMIVRRPLIVMYFTWIAYAFVAVSSAAIARGAPGVFIENTTRLYLSWARLAVDATR